MTGDLGSVDEKIERAEDQIGDLDGRLGAFRAANPDRIHVEGDPANPQSLRYVFRQPEPIPNKFAHMIGEAAHSMRAALDHLICAAVEQNGHSVTKATAFPIWDWEKTTTPSVQQYEAFADRRVKGAGQATVDLVKSLQPYAGGADQHLWVLNYLDCVDKHRTRLLAHYRAGIGIFVGGRLVTQIFAKTADGAPPVPLKDGDVIAAGFPLPTAQDKTYNLPCTDVALGEPWVVQGEPPVPLLRNLVQAVKGTVDQFRLLL